MFTTILVGLDGSTHAVKAATIASDLAATYGSRLVLLHVLPHGHLSEELRELGESEHILKPVGPWPTSEEAVGTPLMEAMATLQDIDEQKDAARRVYELLGNRIIARGKAVADEKGITNVKGVIEDGDPAERILACAQRENADLIVIGNRGLGDFKGLVLGSVSHKVSSLAECTCVTVK